MQTAAKDCFSKRPRPQPHKLLKWADSSKELPSIFLMHLIQHLPRFSQKYTYIPSPLLPPQALHDQFSALGSFLLFASLLLPLCGYFKYRLLRAQISQVMQVCKANMWEDMKLDCSLLSIFLHSCGKCNRTACKVSNYISFECFIILKLKSEKWQ